jgi:Flp pilus assembly protein TadD
LPEAEAAYREAVRLAPSNADYHNKLGLALRAQNKTAEARAAFAQAVRLDPKNAAYQANLRGGDDADNDGG